MTARSGWVMSMLYRPMGPVLIAAGFLLGQAPSPASAQTASGSTETAPAAATVEQPAWGDSQAATEAEAPVGEELVLLAGDEIDALTSRIALYPDPLLELTLQAAIFPLDVVQASRFLEKYAKDKTLQPDPEWDQSVLGLLNYPVVIEAMDEDLDWTQALGEAVVNQLEEVQDSIQQFRAQLYAGGVLVSNDKQRVIVSKDVIAILPANPDLIFVPQYDATAAGAAEAEVEPAAGAPEEAAEPAAEATAEAGTEVVAEASEPGATEYAAAAPGTEAAPVYSQAPVYATAPPVAYSNPYPSFWSTAATFLGGAAVGGLIGYAIGDDDDDGDGDDDDNGNNWSRDVNIEDSNIVIHKDDDRFNNRGRSNLKGKDAQAELRQRQRQREVQNRQRDRQRTQTAEQIRRDAKPRGTAPARQTRTAQPQRQAAVQQRQATGKQAAVKQRPGDKAAKKNAGALSGSKNTSGKQAKAESRRGSQSRNVAQNKGQSRQAANQNRPKGGQGISKPRNGQQAKQHSNRGKNSGGGKKRKRG